MDDLRLEEGHSKSVCLRGEEDFMAQLMLKNAISYALDALVSRSSINPIAAGAQLPDVRTGGSISKVIHQTAKTCVLPAEIKLNIDRIRLLNQDYEYRFYDNADIESYILNSYGKAFLDAYCAINSSYGAARADLFRYMVLYKEGGIYLDVKSAADKPFDSVLAEGDQFVLAQWDNGVGEQHESWGVHPEYSLVEGGEYQQWHIICAPGHPFLRAVITRVLENIDNYRPWSTRFGWKATLATTGPVAFTQVIEAIKDLHPHRQCRDQRELGLRYTIYDDAHSHQKLSPTHYHHNRSPLVLARGLRRAVFCAYSLARRFAGRY